MFNAAQAKILGDYLSRFLPSSAPQAKILKFREGWVAKILTFLAPQAKFLEFLEVKTENTQFSKNPAKYKIFCGIPHAGFFFKTFAGQDLRDKSRKNPASRKIPQITKSAGLRTRDPAKSRAGSCPAPVSIPDSQRVKGHAHAALRCHNNAKPQLAGRFHTLSILVPISLAWWEESFNTEFVKMLSLFSIHSFTLVSILTCRIWNPISQNHLYVLKFVYSFHRELFKIMQDVEIMETQWRKRSWNELWNSWCIVPQIVGLFFIYLFNWIFICR